jgi:ATP-dependent DNA ligase
LRAPSKTSPLIKRRRVLSEGTHGKDRDRLRYFGHSGTGFSEKGLNEAIDRLKPLFTNKSPVENPPKIPEEIQWVQPRLVCEVAYAEWTQTSSCAKQRFSDGVMTKAQRT